MFTDPNRKEKKNASKTVVDPEQLQAPAVPEPVAVQDPIPVPETVDDPEASAAVAPIAETGSLPLLEDTGEPQASQDSEPPVGVQIAPFQTLQASETVVAVAPVANQPVTGKRFLEYKTCTRMEDVAEFLSENSSCS